MTQLPASARRILEERARALAQPLEETAATGPSLELLTFSCAGSAYAIDASDAVAVVPLGELTPVPGTPGAVLGVVNHRGRVLAVVDVDRLVAASGRDATEASLGIVIDTDGAAFVVLTDTVPELASLEEEDVTPTDRPDGVVRGVTSAMAALLDVTALARDPRVAVDHEVE